GLDALGRLPNVADVGTALARQHALPSRQPGEDDESAGMRYILTHVPGGYQPVGVDEVIAVAHQLGGVAVLAHPGRSKGIYAIPATESDLAAMAEAGLDGLEAFYPSHSEDQRAFYRDVAQRLGLLVTGGSDSHGPQQPLAQWPAKWCAAFLERMGV
ncbi:phosphotransferase, partial [Kouleothrix aurantiaca]